MPWIRFQRVEVKIIQQKVKIKQFISIHLKPDLQHVMNVSCDFGGDLMIKSGKTHCIYIQNLQ